MELHYQQHGQGEAILLLHGLFGSLSNLNVLGRNLVENHHVIAADLRNHGQSPWSETMDYVSMASDVITLIERLNLQQVILIGHSMGGKVAMKLADLRPDLIKQLFIIDIAPVSYSTSCHQEVVSALSQVVNSRLRDRHVIIEQLNHQLAMQTSQFLLKSFKNNQWLFNFSAIVKNLPNLSDWTVISPCDRPTIFIKGGKSDYINDKDYPSLLAQFPNACIKTIHGASHTVHADKPEAVLALIKSQSTD